MSWLLKQQAGFAVEGNEPLGGIRRVKRTEIIVPTFYSGYRILTLAEDIRRKKATQLDAFYFSFSLIFTPC